MNKDKYLILIELIAVFISIMFFYIDNKLNNIENIIIILFSIVCFFAMRINAYFVKKTPKLINMISYSLATLFSIIFFILSLIGAIKEKEYNVIILVLFSICLPLCAYFNEIRKLDFNKSK